MRMSCRASCGILLLAAAVGCVAPAATAGAADPDAPEAEVVAEAVAAIGALPTRVLWIGAHPDDELIASPLLYALCHLPGTTCRMLVVTDGGKGNCLLSPEACGVKDAGGAAPGTLGAVRLGELSRSASLLGAGLDALALEDTASDTVLGDMQNWNQALTHVPGDSSIDRMVAVVAQAITAVHADLIVTFDPRHGTYCHPDHRAAGTLAILGAARAGLSASQVLMTELTGAYVDASGQLAQRPWVPSDPALVTYDAGAAGTWPVWPAVMSTHASQFAPAATLLFAAAPAAARRLPFAPLSGELVGGAFPPSPYDAICASETRWDGHGVCPTAAGGTGPCW